ncbi:DUF4351 domain-containing protein, partial [Kerstersia sp.]|uniref:DUF4351 domain-containing protein n=1 Tax=Kerstersia sp. TaxID=1930783 RepID=UPI003F91653B
AVTDYWLGLEDARQKGHEAGVTSGRETGLREVLRRMLTRKFGEVSAESQRCLAGADALKLEQWAEQVLDAATEGEVFR